MDNDPRPDRALHKDVLKLLGYKMVRAGNASALYFRGVQIRTYTDDLGHDGWDWFIPDLDGIMKAIRWAMIQQTGMQYNADYYAAHDKWQITLHTLLPDPIPRRFYAIHGDEATAVAMLFVTMVEAGLVDPKKVNL